MRTTQYIGLTADAQKFVKNLLSVKSKKFAEGMFGEKIPLGRWEWPGTTRKRYLQERVQAEPWSSGPMIFTCLETIYISSDGKEEPAETIYEWVEDPLIKNEYDEVRGRFWV